MQPARAEKPSGPSNCLKCRHFYVSWDPRFPRACRVFGIKSWQLPSFEVYRATGRHCPVYELSPKLKKARS